MLYKAEERPVETTSTDIHAVIRRRFPDFDSAAYRNGTHKPDSFKWLLSGRIGTRDHILGYVGPRFVEVAPVLHHLRHGRYLAYTAPRVHPRGRGMLWAGPYDARTPAMAGRYLRAILRNPLRALPRLHFQSIMIIQPIDALPDGMQTMCDSCPGRTVQEGNLVWSCRLEERTRYGRFMHTVPRA